METCLLISNPRVSKRSNPKFYCAVSHRLTVHDSPSAKAKALCATTFIPIFPSPSAKAKALCATTFIPVFPSPSAKAKALCSITFISIFPVGFSPEKAPQAMLGEWFLSQLKTYTPSSPISIHVVQITDFPNQDEKPGPRCCICFLFH